MVITPIHAVITLQTQKDDIRIVALVNASCQAYHEQKKTHHLAMTRTGRSVCPARGTVFHSDPESVIDESQKYVLKHETGTHVPARTLKSRGRA